MATLVQQRIVPMKAYENGPAAMDWLVNAFGFTERTRWVDDSGRLTHGELEIGGAVVMLAMPSTHYQGPKKHRESCAAAAAWHDVPWVIDGLLVYVDDIRSHFERAREAGATILSEPETTEFGTRYRAEDLEGHRWMFVQSSP
ncbi:MAG TPA: VOC family protein [Tepidiformaceae bacterium]|nr:VOC family protein [Tepidiformaceae bacterium]